MKNKPSRPLAILLVFFILHTGTLIPENSALDSFYSSARDAYHKGDFRASIWQLNTCLELLDPEDSVKKAKILLMISAGYSNLGLSDKARKALKLLRDLIIEKDLRGIPYIKNIKPAKIHGYKTVFGDYDYKVRKVIEKQRKKKKKRSMLPLILTGIALAGVVAAYILLKKKKEVKDLGPYREIEWVMIPAGEFMMGSPTGVGSDDEHPLHAVYLDEYFISKYEVTFEQYDRFCEETGRTKPSTEINPVQFTARGKYPVINISWVDADEYCKWFSQKLGRNVHLPTEAQWEKAARGTDQRIYPWGNQDPNTSLANWGVSTNSATPKIVGSYPAGVSPYGVFDMAGNVWEFCNDWYDAGYYSVSPYKNPTGPLSGRIRVKRGGSYMWLDGSLRSASRGNRFEIIMGPSIGFRPVME